MSPEESRHYPPQTIEQFGKVREKSQSVVQDETGTHIVVKDYIGGISYMFIAMQVLHCAKSTR